MTIAARFSWTRLAAGLVALSMASACHWLAGDFELQPASDSGGTGAIDGAGGLESCTAGTGRCQGAALQICDPTLDPPWRTADTCPSTLACDAAAGLCHVCGPGEHRCAGWQLETCNADGSDFDVTEQCASSVYCDVTQGRCLECLPGEAHCDGATLSVCNAARDGWVVTQCDSADLCNERSQTCRCCVPGELQCTGTSLRQCVADCAWEPVEDCETPELCAMTVQQFPSTTTEDFPGACIPAQCAPGTYQCAADDGRQLLGCPPSRAAWEVYDTCDTAALCDASAGLCRDGCGPGIAPGSYRCQESELQQCSLDGTQFETVKTCASADQCNATRQDCVACVPDEYECSGSTLRRCTAESTWEVIDECASSTLCLADEGRCESPGCVAGTYSCSGNVLSRCAADNSSWEPVEYCVTDALCDAAAGHCSLPGCPWAGAVDCAGNVLRSCPASLVAWEVLQTCPDGALCDAQNQQCISECPTPPFQCQAGVPMECTVSADGALAWQPTAPPCTTNALCTASASGAWCLSPLCDVGDYQCTTGTPPVLQTCAVGRNQWNDVATCTAGICDPIGAQCDVCVANTFSCDGASLQQCGPAGQVLEARGTCRDAEHCFASGPEGYCYVCDPDETQCSGTNQIQECTADRGGFGAPTTCDFGCQDNAGNADYCAGCPTANEVQCVTEDRPGSTRTCPPDRRLWGPTETCDAGLGCVNDGIADYCADTCAPNQPSCVGATGVHTCSATGEGFDATRYECADATHLKQCVGGVLSDTAVVACPAATPNCVNGVCVECTGTTRQCVPDTASRRECVNGTWQLENCAARTDGNVVCYQGSCAPCNDASSPSCLDNDTRHHCVSGAWTDTTCTGTTPVCSAVLANCSACNAGSAATCDDATTRRSCVTSTGTWTTTTCPVRCLVVSGQGTCVACDPANTPTSCNTAADGIVSCSANGTLTTTPCVAPTPVCTTSGGVAACVGCASGTCTGTTPYCLNGVECVACQPGAVTCQQTAPVSSGLCSAEGDWTYTPCAAPTPLCNAGGCVECSASTDCAAPTPVCSANHCVECVTGTDCAAPTPVCSANNCVECVTNTDCAAPTPVCSANNCVECVTSTDCDPSTPVCSANNCVGCANASDCTVTGQTCVGGQCQCAATLTPCDGACVDLSSNDAHCGACETACSDVQSCSDGSCVCDDPLLTNCSGACVDLTSDAAHCGNCTTSCTAGAYCLTGACVECRDDTDCSSATPTCNAYHQCV
jgi:hypothetical protein